MKKGKMFLRALMALALVFGSMSAAKAEDSFYLDPVAVAPGETATLSFSLDNEMEYFGFQADISLPEGLEIVAINGKPVVKLSSRCGSDYTLVSNLIDPRYIRLGTFSLGHSPIKENSGVLLFMDVTASDDFDGGMLKIEKVLFVNSEDRDEVLPDSSCEIAVDNSAEEARQEANWNAYESEKAVIDILNEKYMTVWNTISAEYPEYAESSEFKDEFQAIGSRLQEMLDAINAEIRNVWDEGFYVSQIPDGFSDEIDAALEKLMNGAVETGVCVIEYDGTAEYYTVDGHRLSAPVKGQLNIIRRGGNTEKVFVK